MHLELMRDAAKEFPHIADPDPIRTARVWHCKFKTLAPLSRLRNLETLVIASYPDSSLAPLAHLSQLRLLSILHLPRVDDLSPLASLAKLESLSLGTLPSWDSSGKVQVVSSLASLAALPSLRHLELLGVVPPDRSLSHVRDCKRLESARFSKFPKRQIREFFSATGVSDSFNPAPVLPAA